jgi:hypothetical protein
MFKKITKLSLFLLVFSTHSFALNCWKTFYENRFVKQENGIYVLHQGIGRYLFYTRNQLREIKNQSPYDIDRCEDAEVISGTTTDFLYLCVTQDHIDEFNLNFKKTNSVVVDLKSANLCAAIDSYLLGSTSVVAPTNSFLYESDVINTLFFKREIDYAAIKSAYLKDLETENLNCNKTDDELKTLYEAHCASINKIASDEEFLQIKNYLYFENGGKCSFNADIINCEDCKNGSQNGSDDFCDWHLEYAGSKSFKCYTNCSTGNECQKILNRLIEKCNEENKRVQDLECKEENGEAKIFVNNVEVLEDEVLCVEKNNDNNNNNNDNNDNNNDNNFDLNNTNNLLKDIKDEIKNKNFDLNNTNDLLKDIKNEIKNKDFNLTSTNDLLKDLLDKNNTTDLTSTNDLLKNLLDKNNTTDLTSTNDILKDMKDLLTSINEKDFNSSRSGSGSGNGNGSGDSNLSNLLSGNFDNYNDNNVSTEELKNKIKELKNLDLNKTFENINDIISDEIVDKIKNKEIINENEVTEKVTEILDTYFNNNIINFNSILKTNNANLYDLELSFYKDFKTILPIISFYNNLVSKKIYEEVEFKLFIYKFLELVAYILGFLKLISIIFNVSANKIERGDI